MEKPSRRTGEDVLSFISRAFSRLHTQWLLWTYPFHSIGAEFWAHSSSDVRRSIAPYIAVGSGVKLDRDVWLNIPFIPAGDEPVILLEDGCRIGRRCMISAQNRIQIGKNTIFAPSALVMDHNHAFEDVNVPIIDQGTTKGGTIRIEEGCWIGFGAAIVCSQGELVVGKNSVIGANAVVTRSIPPYSVVTGNPGRVVKQFDPAKGQWVIGSSGYTGKSRES
jgi:acetyltransferase-like isoleucine patch superfamily enzyme